MPRILIERGKHGDTHHDASTDDKLAAVALAIVTERLESGDYYYDPDAETHPFSLNLRRERDELLAAGDGDDSPALHALRETPQYKSAVADWESDTRDRNFLVRVHTAVEAGDGAECWRILLDRSGAEYERVDLETTADAPEPDDGLADLDAYALRQLAERAVAEDRLSVETLRALVREAGVVPEADAEGDDWTDPQGSGWKGD